MGLSEAATLPGDDEWEEIDAEHERFMADKEAEQARQEELEAQAALIGRQEELDAQQALMAAIYWAEQEKQASEEEREKRQAWIDALTAAQAAETATPYSAKYQEPNRAKGGAHMSAAGDIVSGGLNLLDAQTLEFLEAQLGPELAGFAASIVSDLAKEAVQELARAAGLDWLADELGAWQGPELWHHQYGPGATYWKETPGESPLLIEGDGIWNFPNPLGEVLIPYYDIIYAAMRMQASLSKAFSVGQAYLPRDHVLVGFIARTELGETLRQLGQAIMADLKAAAFGMKSGGTGIYTEPPSLWDIGSDEPPEVKDIDWGGITINDAQMPGQWSTMGDQFIASAIKQAKSYDVTLASGLGERLIDTTGQLMDTLPKAVKAGINQEQAELIAEYLQTSTAVKAWVAAKGQQINWKSGLEQYDETAPSISQDAIMALRAEHGVQPSAPPTKPTPTGPTGDEVMAAIWAGEMTKQGKSAAKGLYGGIVPRLIDPGLVGQAVKNAQLPPKQARPYKGAGKAGAYGAASPGATYKPKLIAPELVKEVAAQAGGMGPKLGGVAKVAFPLGIAFMLLRMFG